jgi:hypothetical protein
MKHENETRSIEELEEDIPTTCKDVATLTLAIDSATATTSSFTQTGPKTYKITIRRGLPGNEVTDIEAFRTTLAHELGHFVLALSLDPTHDPTHMFDYLLSHDPATLLPGERKAWTLASLIYPALDSARAARCLHSYERVPSTCSDCGEYHDCLSADHNSTDGCSPMESAATGKPLVDTPEYYEAKGRPDLAAKVRGGSFHDCLPPAPAPSPAPAPPSDPDPMRWYWPLAFGTCLTLACLSILGEACLTACEVLR